MGPLLAAHWDERGLLLLASSGATFQCHEADGLWPCQDSLGCHVLDGCCCFFCFVFSNFFFFFFAAVFGVVLVFGHQLGKYNTVLFSKSHGTLNTSLKSPE